MIAFRIAAVAALLCAAGCTSSKYASNMEPTGEWEPANPGFMSVVAPLASQPGLAPTRTARAAP